MKYIIEVPVTGTYIYAVNADSPDKAIEACKGKPCSTNINPQWSEAQIISTLSTTTKRQELWDKYLGQDSDPVLAKKVGVSHTVICRRRKKLEIPPLQKKSMSTGLCGTNTSARPLIWT
jgi:hypothetical protein